MPVIKEAYRRIRVDHRREAAMTLDGGGEGQNPARQLRAGAQVSEVALRHGVNRGLLWSWRRQLRKQNAERGFVPIQGGHALRGARLPRVAVGLRPADAGAIARYRPSVPNVYTRIKSTGYTRLT